MSVAFHPLKIRDVRRETSEAVAIAFAVPPELAEAYRFDPGQHLTLRTMLGGAETRRSYSICTGPDDRDLRVVVKKQDDGLFSNWIHAEAKPGDPIDVMTPQGRFGIRPDPDASRNYLAIAAGSGITPLMSIVRCVLARELKSRVVLLYGNRTAQSIIFKRELQALKDRHLDRLSVYHVLSRERQELELFNGRIDERKIAAVLKAALPAEAIDHAFLCGPGDLIETSRAALLRLGLPPERIHVEHFTVDGMPASAAVRVERKIDAKAEAAATIEIRLNGLDHLVPLQAGETIVEAGLRQGLEMPYSCRGGMCCTCRAKLVSGEVKMDRNFSLEPWELAAGYVLTCQSHPLTPQVAVDYDHV
jgi:ring-1,2-phenylacetyl-CoA epoxidase subunit PaaE